MNKKLKKMEVLSPHIVIRESMGWDVGYLRSDLRFEDRNEILRLGVSIEKALWQSYRTSIFRRTAYIDGKIAAMWGCIGDLMSNKGEPWLLTSPEVRKISPLKFTRIYQEQVAEMLKLFEVLENHVDSEYASALRLLDILGASFYPAEKIGNGMFYKFRIGA